MNSKHAFLGLFALGSALTLSVSAQSVGPELMFKDTFDVPENTTDLGLNAALRQSGSVAPLTYSRNPADGDNIQLGAPDAPGQLRLFSPSYVSPDHNFTEGGKFTIEFDVNPGIDDLESTSGDWCAVVFGATSQNPFVNGSNGIGILFRNSGDIQVFDGGTSVYGGGGEYPGGIPKDQYHVRIEVETDNFLGGSPATARMFINGTQVKIGAGDSMTLTKAAGLKGNYVTLEGLGFPGPWTHAFDNLSVTAVPCITVSPISVDRIVGQTSDAVTVTIPKQLNASQATSVKVSSLNKAVAVPVGADANGVLTLNFPAGGSTSKTFTVSAVGAGSTAIVATGPDGVCVSTSLQVNVAAGVGLAEVLFQDNFDTSGANNDVNFENAAGRQNGSSVGVLPYTEAVATAAGGANDDLTQLTGTELSLNPVGGVANWVSVSPNHNFTEGGEFSVEFDVDPGSNDFDNASGDWVAVVLGASARNMFVNASDGIGILFRNSGPIQLFDGGAAVYGGDGDLPGGLPLSKFHVKINVSTFGFAGTPATVSLFIDGQQARLSANSLSYVKPAGLKGNYVTLLGYADAGNAWFHTVDNLKVSALACITAAPTTVFTTAGDADKTFTVTIPSLMNTGKAAAVSVTSANPQVAIPVGAVNGRLTLNFAAGAARTQTVTVQALQAGDTQFIIGNDAGVCTGDPVQVSVAPAAPPVLCENFNAGSLPAVLRVNPAPFETGTVDGQPTVSGGQVQFELLGLESYWGGVSIDTEQTFSATAAAPLTVELDRVSQAGITSAGSATRTGIWLTDQIRSRYVFFSDNEGEGGWQVNSKLGLTTDNPTGGGANIALFDGLPYDDGGLHHIKLVANGTTVRIFLDGVLGTEVPFPLTSGIMAGFGAYTRASGDSVSAKFDNFCVLSSLPATLPCVIANPNQINGMVGTTATVSVTVPKLLNQAQATSVTLESADASVATLVGAVNGKLTLNFPAGDTGPKTAEVNLLKHGQTTINLSNSDGACIYSPVAVVSRSSFILNPSFEENYPATWPHYGPANGWNGSTGIGVNKGDGPFHDNGVIPDRSQVLLVQGTTAVSQDLAGLIPGKSYWVQFHYNARNCCGGTISLSVRFAGEELATLDVTPVLGSNPYRTASVKFVASADAGTLQFATAASGDATVLIDAVGVVQRDDGNVVIMNPSFEASGMPAWPGYLQPGRLSGWTGAGNYGVNFSGAGPFADNGENQDQDLVALIQGQGSSLSQEISGLNAGQNYTLTFAVNARGGNAPHLRVSVNGTAVLDDDVTAVGGTAAYLVKRVVFAAPADKATLKFEETAPGDNTLLLDNVAVVPGGTVEEKVSLKVARVDASSVRVSWPTSATGYHLQSAATLPGAWQNSGAPVVVEGNENAVYINPSGLSQFFRLQK